ncbi:MAG: DNA translocase FtsK [marine benthic group bacterium]|nr:DNA translocase FtsK [Candidatus Benthicola marisminoris]
MNERQRREALGVGLVALGVLVTLALVPQMLPGRAESGNLIGPAGELLNTGLNTVFGTSSVLVALPAFVWALWGFGILEKKSAIRWSVLAVGGMLFLPAAWWFLSRAWGGSGTGAGWLGAATAGVLTRAFGTVGAQLIVAAFVAALVVLTLGVSPRRAAEAVGRSARWLGRHAWRGLQAGSTAAGGRWTAWREREKAAGPDPSIWEQAEPEPQPEVVPDPPTPAVVEDEGPEEEQLQLPEYGDPSEEELPPIELLKLPTRAGPGLAGAQLERLGQILVDKLATFRVEGSIGGWTTGPVVTQFEVIPAEGVKVGQISALADDLALALKAPSVRIVAPIPGKGAVGVEVPNPEPEIVRLREVLESPGWQRHRGALPLGLGRDLDGNPYTADLARMPHLLIAGATGSGKSVCINTIVTSLIYRYSPRDLRLLMIDPKMVELIVYNDLPHLRHPVVTDNNDAAAVLRWTVHEMSRRYKLLSANACRNVIEINRRIRAGEELKRPDGWGKGLYEEGTLPYIVLVIDELADLMMTVQGEVETPLAILAQKARAVGIHLVVATQRPSVNVITGLIKANFPCRIAFRVASKTDSRTIIDQNGAESLLGNGDMLFLEPAESDPHRIQGAFLDTEETEQLIAWYRERAAARAERDAEEQDILEEVRELELEESQVDVSDEVMADWDPYFRKAAEIVIHNGAGSTSLLQRRLKIGYGRAARIIDQLHEVGVLGPPDGSRPREVMVSLAQLDSVLRGDDLRAQATESAAGAEAAPGPEPEHGNTGTAPEANG